ncbi:MAG: hypothetical protein SFW36_04635, partial [Leptolyngbyaceae cyanobacterium bins.59]|nr:hypothetical protein [Leptolyngbyaceae cyanobacterium bins.59]
MTQQSLLEQAKQGNVQAINVLLNRVFQLNGITAKTTIQDGCLHLLLESAQVPNKQTLVPAIRGAMLNLGVESVEQIAIYGRQIGTQQPAWSQKIQLGAPGYRADSPNVEQKASAAFAALEVQPSLLSPHRSALPDSDPPILEKTSPAIETPEVQLPLSSPAVVSLSDAEAASVLAAPISETDYTSADSWQILPQNDLEESTFEPEATTDTSESNGSIPSSLPLTASDPEVTEQTLITADHQSPSNYFSPIQEKATEVPLVDDLEHPSTRAIESSSWVETNVRGSEVTHAPSRNLRAGRNGLLAGLAGLVIGILWLHNSVIGQQKLVLEEAQVLAGSVKSAKEGTSIDDLKTGA